MKKNVCFDVVLARSLGAILHSRWLNLKTIPIIKTPPPIAGLFFFDIVVRGSSLGLKGRTIRSFLLSALIVAMLAAAPRRADADLGTRRCYLAFVHGSGSNYDANPEASIEYWRPDRISWNYRSLPEQAAGWPPSLVYLAPANGCQMKVIGYNGTQEWWADAAAGSVARQLNAFISLFNIPDGQLIIVTHSMGGLVARYLLNSAEPNSPYFAAGQHLNLANIKKKTKYVITIQAPHMGSEAADALYWDATSFGANVNGILGRIFAGQDQTRARSTMTRGYMEDAWSWMGDAGRTTKIWSIAGFSTWGSESRADTAAGVHDKDSDLNLLSRSLFSVEADYFANDGMVEERSAHGMSILKENKWSWWPPAYNLDYSSRRLVQGAFTTWVSTPLNHNHGRYSDIATGFYDTRSDKKDHRSLGSKIFDHGLDLPCSDPEARQFFGWCR
jgi:hypothetical protein